MAPRYTFPVGLFFLIASMTVTSTTRGAIVEEANERGAGYHHRRALAQLSRFRRSTGKFREAQP